MRDKLAAAQATSPGWVGVYGAHALVGCGQAGNQRLCVCADSIVMRLHRLAAQRSALQQQVQRLQAARDAESSVQQQYEATVGGFLQERGSRTQELQQALARVEARLQQLQQQEASAQLDQHISTLTQQHATLQAKLQQLTATLTASKQANACVQGRVDAAATATATAITFAQVPRCVWH